MKHSFFKFMGQMGLITVLILAQQASLLAQCACETTVGSNVGIPNLTSAPASVQTITNGCIRVNGSFEVNSGTWTLTNTKVLFVSTGSSVIVNGGCGINATQSSSFTACSGNWTSITLSGNSTANFDQCTFSGFNTAISVTAKATFTVTRNIFNATNTGTCIRIASTQHPLLHNITGNRFNNAKIGINVIGNVVRIGTNNYVGSGIIGNPLIMTGVEIAENVRDVRILGGSFFVLETGVNIRKLSKDVFVTDMIFSGNTGVFSQQSLGNITVQNSTIRATLTGIQINDAQTSGSITSSANISIVRNTISSTSQSGIRITQTYGNGRIEIIGNSIFPETTPNSFAHYGIGITTVSNSNAFVKIENNSIRQVGTGNQNLYAPGGIYLQKCKAKSLILDNIVFAQNSGGLTFGITVAESPRCQVVGNSINKAGTYNKTPTNLMQRGISMENNQDNILLCCNTINSANRGLNMAGNMENCNIYNTVFDTLPVALYYDQITTSSALQFHRGNNWNSSTTNWDAYFNGSNLIALQSKYRVDPTLMPSLLSKVFVSGGSPTDWFSNPSSNEAICANSSDSYCGSTPFQGLSSDPNGNVGLTGNDLWAAQANTDATYSVVHWEAQRYLYQKLVNNPTLVSQNSTVSSFYSNAANNNIGKFEAIESGLAHRYDDPALTGQVTSNLLVQNAAIVPATDAQTNEKNINSILLNALLSESWSFSNSDKSTIDYVASLCPLSGGRAVYTARWLQEYYRVPDWSAQCGTVLPRSEPETARINSGRMILYPNPAQDAVQVVLDGTLPDDYQLIVTNFTGQIVEQKIIKAGTEQVFLNTERLANGCYVVRILSGKQQGYQQKLVIAR